MRELLHAARTSVQDYSGPRLVAERKSVLVGTAQPFMESNIRATEIAGERSDNVLAVMSSGQDNTGRKE